MDLIGNSATFAIVSIVFIAQLYLSKWWMQYLSYGPFKWFWRSLLILSCSHLDGEGFKNTF